MEMRILQVCQTHPPEFSGGSTVYAVMLGEELAKRGFSVNFLCNTKDRSLLPYELNTTTTDLYQITRMGMPLKSWYGRKHTLKVKEVCKKILSQMKVDLVHIHSTLGLGEGVLLAAKSEGIPSIVTTHEGMWICPNLYFRNNWTGRVCNCASFAKCLFCTCRPGDSQNYPIKAMPRVIARSVKYNSWVLNQRKSYLSLADHIIGCCQFIKDKYLEFGVDRPISVIKNRIKESEILFKPVRAPGQRIIFGTLGAFRPKKGGDLLLKALSFLGDSSDRFELHIWGSTHPEFSNRSENLFREPHIKVHGAYERMSLNEILSGMDVLVYPSCSGDTYPLVLIEALASRTPIIAARTHGMAEIVKDGENGKFFAPLNAASLSNAMRFFIESPESIVEMQKNIAPPLPYDGLVDANVEIYRSLANSGDND
jgi:glycosyltransferase involved in cell wall biosynthesis